MMRITIEVVPFGVETDKHVIRSVNIWNTGEKNDRYQYRYLFSKEDAKVIRSWPKDTRADRADGGVWHCRAEGADTLATLVLNALHNRPQTAESNPLD